MSKYSNNTDNRQSQFLSQLSRLWTPIQFVAGAYAMVTGYNDLQQEGECDEVRDAELMISLGLGLCAGGVLQALDFSQEGIIKASKVMLAPPLLAASVYKFSNSCVEDIESKIPSAISTYAMFLTTLFCSQFTTQLPEYFRSQLPEEMQGEKKDALLIKAFKNLTEKFSTAHLTDEELGYQMIEQINEDLAPKMRDLAKRVPEIQETTSPQEGGLNKGQAR